MKKELLERLEDFKNEDINYYMLVSDAGVLTHSDFKQTLTLVTTLLKSLMEHNMPEDALKECFRIAKMSDKELLLEVKNKLDKLMEEN